jgi:hypothetical protein
MCGPIQSICLPSVQTDCLSAMPENTAGHQFLKFLTAMPSIHSECHGFQNETLWEYESHFVMKEILITVCIELSF